MSELSELTARKALYLEAEAAVLKMQSYSINGQTFTRADLGKIQSELREISNRIMLISKGSTTAFVSFKRP